MNLIMLCFILISFLVVFADCLFSFHFHCSKLRLLVYLENYLRPDKSQGKARVRGWNQSVKLSSAPAPDSKKSTWPWPANETTREYAGWEAGALFPWIQSLKGVTRTFAATLLLKRKSFPEDRTHREEDGSPLKAWMARNHFVRILFGPLFGAECKASVLLDISLIGVSQFFFFFHYHHFAWVFLFTATERIIISTTWSVLIAFWTCFIEVFFVWLLGWLVFLFYWLIFI